MFPLDRFGFQGSAANISHEFRNSLAGPPPDFHNLHWFSESVPLLAVRYRYKGILANVREMRLAETLLLRQTQEVMAPAKHIMLCITGDIQFKVIDKIGSNGETHFTPSSSFSVVAAWVWRQGV